MSKNTTNSIYAQALRMLEKTQGFKDAGEYVANAEAIVKHFRTDYPNINTRKVRLAAVMRAIRDAKLDVPLEYSKEMATITEACLAAGRAQKLPLPRAEQMMTWRDVLALKDTAKKELSAEDYLIFSLYTLQPPVRADYVGMTVLNYYTKHHKADTSRNYCVLHTARNRSFFVFNVYKTAPTYGQTVVRIDERLADIIREANRMGGSLLTLETPNQLSKRVMSIFGRLAERPKMGIGLLRHSYITTFLKNFQSIERKEEVARQMLHSKAIQEEYAVADAVADAGDDEE